MTRSHKIGLQDAEADKATGKERRDNHYVLHFECALQLIRVFSSFMVESSFEYPSKLRCVHSLYCVNTSKGVKLELRPLLYVLMLIIMFELV